MCAFTSYLRFIVICDLEYKGLIPVSLEEHSTRMSTNFQSVYR